ncbi:MAG: hypothetical protein CBE19_02635 [Pelagibacteraceae bacterium TMED259]|nr:MAG: hypothetical protein CBE19_02635 [Pelagibacteraceae bacterium TMED259]
MILKNCIQYVCILWACQLNWTIDDLKDSLSGPRFHSMQAPLCWRTHAPGPAKQSLVHRTAFGTLGSQLPFAA